MTTLSEGLREVRDLVQARGSTMDVWIALSQVFLVPAKCLHSDAAQLYIENDESLDRAIEKAERVEIPQSDVEKDERWSASISSNMTSQSLVHWQDKIISELLKRALALK